MQAELTMIVELGEQVLNTQESWKLRNAGGKMVDARELSLDLPANASRLRLDADVDPFHASDDFRRIEARGPLGPGEHSLAGTYQIAFSGDAAELGRRIPFALRGIRVITENITGLELSSSVEAEKRIRELNGLEFAVWDLAPVAPGSSLTIALRGLPTRPKWPKQLAVGAAAAILLWAVWMISRKRSPAEETTGERRLGTLSAGARKERILKAIELLERERGEGQIEDKRYERRHAALLADLAAALREEALEAGRAPADDPIRSA